MKERNCLLTRDSELKGEGWSGSRSSSSCLSINSQHSSGKSADFSAIAVLLQGLEEAEAIEVDVDVDAWVLRALALRRTSLK